MAFIINPRGLPEIGFLLHLADELALLAAALLAGLLVERRALDVARQALFFAGLLESLEELVETLVHPDFDADQALTSFQFTRYAGDYSARPTGVQPNSLCMNGRVGDEEGGTKGDAVMLGIRK